MHYSAKRSLAIGCRPSVCPSVTLVDHYHVGWKSWKLIARTISLTSLLFVAQRSSTYSQGNMEKFLGENVRSTPIYAHNVRVNWVNRESRDLRWRCGCLLLSAHRAVIFAISQLSCFTLRTDSHSIAVDKLAASSLFDTNKLHRS